jgi:hypothetical protein
MRRSAGGPTRPWPRRPRASEHSRHAIGATAEADLRLAPATPALQPAALTASEVAWVALLPCALLAVAAIALLGPPLGHALVGHTSDQLWPPGWWQAAGHPEPSKQGRFLVAVLAPLLLVAAILAGVRRRLALPPRTVRTLSLTSYALIVALLVVALLEQRLKYVVPEEFGDELLRPTIVGPGSVLAAAVLVAVALLLLRRSSIAQRVAAAARETRARRWALGAVAIGFTAIWLLKAVVTDRLGFGVVALNLPWSLNDAIAVLDGRTPLVDYHPTYAKLFPYLSAPVLSVIGTTALAFTAFMALLDGLVLVAVYAVFRRVTRSSLYACALFLPFVAASDVNVRIDASLLTSPFTLAALWPMRYGGAYLLAWLTVRHVDGCRPRHAWIIFFFGGLVAVDNLDFGLGAIAATVAALLFARPPSSARAALRLLAHAVGGVLAAVALVVVIVLVRAGQLPDPGMLLEWPRIFTRLGLLSLPLQTWGLHLVLYATYVAAIALAAVRLARRDDDVLLTAMLAWSGVFGLLAGSYFVTRPDAIKLTGELSAWSLALSMLTIVCVRALATRRWRPTVPQLLVLLGFALSLCTLSQLPLPQDQLHRLTRPTPGTDYLATAKQFVGERTRRGDTVVVLLPMGAAITHDLGLRNVAPYAFMNAIVTQSQMTEVLDTLRRERVRELFVPAAGSALLREGDSAPLQLELLEAIGFTRAATQGGILEFRRS